MAPVGFTVVVTPKGGAPSHHTINGAECTIGRAKTNDIALSAINIDRRHARLVVRDSKVIIVDFKTTNGTWVNGRRVSAPQVLKPDDVIYIGDFKLSASVGAKQEVRVVGLDRLMALLREARVLSIDLVTGMPPDVVVLSRPVKPGRPITAEAVRAVFAAVVGKAAEGVNVFDGVVPQLPNWRVTARGLLVDPIVDSPAISFRRTGHDGDDDDL